MKVFLGLPHHQQSMTVDTARAVFAEASRGGVQLEIADAKGSLLARGFNLVWCMALERYQAGEADVFCLLHADVAPEQFWLDSLLAERARCGADILGLVLPLKDARGLSSTAISHAESDWQVEKRLTMTEIMALPETFTAADAGFADRILLLNTGCLLIDLHAAWLQPCLEAEELPIFFTVRDAVARIDGHFCPLVEPEDWAFSRQAFRLGAKLAATRKVKAKHWGEFAWPNVGRWGHCQLDPLAEAQQAVAGIHPHGFWLTASQDGSAYDPGLARAMLEALPGSLLDLGCGRGEYVQFFRAAGRDSRGVDGNPQTAELAGPDCGVADLAVAQDLGPADWVLSMEVGEHIPSCFTPVYLDNLLRHARQGLVVSWAQPDQSGRGHVNCRPRVEVLDWLVAGGFEEDRQLTASLRDAAGINYLKRNLLAVRRARSQMVTS